MTAVDWRMEREPHEAAPHLDEATARRLRLKYADVLAAVAMGLVTTYFHDKDVRQHYEIGDRNVDAIINKLVYYRLVGHDVFTNDLVVE